ncbi:PadR family transcriptional regulator [Nonomuraea sp. NPDC049649]|uniref:PadR family transcriptional regulator n=1 Tax=Nonomuraea sp. NPDC049649 TaxID=3155776 RepID=UPI00341997E2
MARKVGNLLALAVLAALLERPMHPYEIASTLRERGKVRDMDLKISSLYTVVRNLDRHGLVEAAGSERQGARPERTVYRITPAGREELEDWERELIATPVTEQSRFKAALSVLGVLPPDEAARLLRLRLRALEEHLTGLRGALDAHLTGVPRLFLLEDEYELAQREAEAAWVRALVAELDDATFPGLAEWRAYHKEEK